MKSIAHWRGRANCVTLLNSGKSNTGENLRGRKMARFVLWCWLFSRNRACGGNEDPSPIRTGSKYCIGRVQNYRAGIQKYPGAQRDSRRPTASCHAVHHSISRRGVRILSRGKPFRPGDKKSKQIASKMMQMMGAINQTILGSGLFSI